MTAQGGKRKVCLFDFEPIQDFHGYEIHTFDPFLYIERRKRFSVGDFVRWGISNYLVKNPLYSAEQIDRLYRARDRHYMRLLSDFVERFKDFDVIILANYNPIHPDVLYHELKKPIKVLGFIDDPFSSYVRGVSYLWAFDGAFYISPSYDERSLLRRRWKSGAVISIAGGRFVQRDVPSRAIRIRKNSLLPETLISYTLEMPMVLKWIA